MRGFTGCSSWCDDLVVGEMENEECFFLLLLFWVEETVTGLW